MQVVEAFDLIAHAIDSGHPAHGYLLCGDLQSSCRELTDRILQKLFPGCEEQIEDKTHPDIVYLEPEGKKNIIKVDSMRDRIVDPMGATAFSGGWKVGVIVSADRMEAASANAFLKSLEEPSPKTLYLLLTDTPDAMLPTIVSRTQRINLPADEGVLTDEAYDEVSKAFAAHDAAQLATLYTELKDEADEGDVALVRKRFFKTIMSFVRPMMFSDRLPRYQAFRNVEAVEEAYRQSCQSISDDAVIAFLMDRLHV